MYGYLAEHLPLLAALIIFANIIVAGTVVFLERKNPTTTLTWVMVVFFLPAIGIFLYFMLSNRLIRKRISLLTKEDEAFIRGSLQEQMAEMAEGAYKFNSKRIHFWKDMITLNQILGKSYYSQNNDIQIITDGQEMFDTLLTDIRNAESSINVLYFIIKPDEVGKRLLRTLTEKAREGVEVTVIGDGLGCRGLTRKMLAPLRRAGGTFKWFLPIKLKYLSPRLNYRNHRKLVIIDDKIGYLGGFNIGREYLGRKKKFGYWRDTQLKLTGSAVQDINARFMQDLRFATKKDIHIKDVYFSETIGEGGIGVQIVSSGPDTSKEEIKRGFNRMVSTAQERIWIQTPYFVPSTSLHENLKVAILSGVDVRIMIPNKPDHMFVYWATWAFVGELIELGAKVYIYDKGFMHAKTMVVDGEISTVGTANFDRRSFRLSFETNAFIYSGRFAQKMEDIFLEDMDESYMLTKELYRNRGIFIKAKESICRLLSDLL